MAGKSKGLGGMKVLQSASDFFKDLAVRVFVFALSWPCYLLAIFAAGVYCSILPERCKLPQVKDCCPRSIRVPNCRHQRVRIPRSLQPDRLLMTAFYSIQRPKLLLSGENVLPIPDTDGPFGSLSKRCRSTNPLGILRLQDDFCLCYSSKPPFVQSILFHFVKCYPVEFAVFVDMTGKIRLGPFEWEGEAQHVAFSSPYIILFSLNLIEIRLLPSCHLIQVISGSDVRCLTDGMGMSSPQILATMRTSAHPSSVLGGSGPGSMIIGELRTVASSLAAPIIT
jgi:hypothetical protein